MNHPHPMFDEIEEVRAQQTMTRRAVSEGMEELLYKIHPVLDHGFVRVVDYMGNDAAIVQAARVSYGKGTKKMREDEGLIRYLLRHRHTTPFEMCEVKFHIKLPIFIARQWIRHRTANVNEYSGRYSVMDKDFYLPAREHLAAQSASNRQGRGDILEGLEADHALELLRSDSERAYAHYEELLNSREGGEIIHPDKQGLARELARMNLPVNYYTQWYWKIDLHNLMHFLALRVDSHAQYEIRVYAQTMLDIMKAWVPITHQALMDYRIGATELSAQARKVIARRLAGEDVTQETSGMSAREWEELQRVIG
ncbi:MAG: FAD-dependent thymidylate synthase [Alphaproteobacteria bacterium]|nr:MAG: FAD-dependent thymidylate synthase [Alphaproteobacteria bacterium]